MKDDIRERNSAPTGANETLTEKNKKASDPLGDATCSAGSYYGEKKWVVFMLAWAIAVFGCFGIVFCLLINEILKHI